MDKLSRIKAAVDTWSHGPGDIESALDALSSVADILYDVDKLTDAADYLDECAELARDDAIDEAHADPELNAIANLRTKVDEVASQVDMPLGSDYLRQVLDLCDAYIGLRAQCPRGAIVVVQGSEFTGEDEDGNPTTFFDAVVGALDLADVHAYLSEVPLKP